MTELIHGKASTYNHHGCRCRACTDAAVEYNRQYRAATGYVPPNPHIYPTTVRRERQYGYDVCPNCGGVKTATAKLCRDCYNNIGRASGNRTPDRDSRRMRNRQMVTGG